MTRKHYVAIAEGIAAIRASLTVAHTDAAHRDIALSAVDSTTLKLAEVLQEDNERFDRDRFLLASDFGKGLIAGWTFESKGARVLRAVTQECTTGCQRD